MVEDDVPQLYSALIDALAPIGLAYLHAIATTEEDALIALRKASDEHLARQIAGCEKTVSAKSAQGVTSALTRFAGFAGGWMASDDFR
jgi:hypothetical protein